MDLKKPFYFEIILDLQKSCKNCTENSHWPSTQLPLMLTTDCKSQQNYQNQEINIETMILLNYRSYSNLFSFLIVSFFQSSILFGIPHCIQFMLPLPPLSVTFPQSYFAFQDLDAFEEHLLVSYFFRKSLSLGLSSILLCMIRCKLCILAKKNTEVKIRAFNNALISASFQEVQ